METEEVSQEIIREVSMPIIVYPGMQDMVPSLLRERIMKERLALAVAGEQTASDAEVALYMMTASLSFPLSHEWAETYFFAFTKTMDGAGVGVPEDLRVTQLTPYIRDEYYGKLKSWLYERRKKLGTSRARKARAVSGTATASPDGEVEVPVAPIVEQGATGWLF